MKKGFSLPLWVAGAARSALKKLLGFPFDNYELIKIPNEKKEIKIEIHSVGLIKDNSYALGISFAKSGLDLDVTQNLEIWTIVSLEKIFFDNPTQTNSINIIAGSGVGINQNTHEISISDFAKEVLYANLLDTIPDGFNLNLEIIFPNGKFLAERTSNKSFGIVDGLSIIGTSAETYSSASPDQLEEAKNKLSKLIKNDFKGKVVFVIGENGLNLAKTCKINLPTIKVGNWIGPLIVDAAIKNVQTVILFGYHGKLIKLAGGIFHTHNHLADGRIEVLVYLAVKEKIPPEIIVKLSHFNTVEDALLFLEGFDKSTAEKLFQKLSNTIETRSFEYVNRYVKTDMKIASIIFDRKRKIRWSGTNGNEYISYFQKD
ncbi:cobalt-precorrin-5B (C(1))-methyltransferase [Prochlorococcus marinus str. MU1404]|uniref:cobalt-precorrin-5B (C(1))-methyltransferase CbiD n=1 Tax=Prochlorococcus marinus TaxID=1219 RepID=UPI001ADAF940|nr:cobalt-precorrin-5B (C(1))-methyltransferase CbiD [Prochlorococcus marinus]MBO8229200.1 cobalt-precorrin-5B (C(1))-methyltransferase [Prochlorococcus marinus XMU1404]MBW3072284.1 cobalt-precorrin-5B (C(1))-methyltransferase [Prochlorococcus marinus str. MU1404]MCR8544617.1 cobalt-precorrin-5B (C(1))-methyltransferase CbiD [Prochlorococcus marinus CUG1432]